MMIKEKYAAGSCPEVDGKVVWSKTLSCAPLTAQQIYDRMIAFLQDYCKQEGKDSVMSLSRTKVLYVIVHSLITPCV